MLIGIWAARAQAVGKGSRPRLETFLWKEWHPCSGGARREALWCGECYTDPLVRAEQFRFRRRRWRVVAKTLIGEVADIEVAFRAYGSVGTWRREERQCVVWSATVGEEKTSGRFMRVGRSRVRVVLLSSRETHAIGAADQVMRWYK